MDRRTFLKVSILGGVGLTYYVYTDPNAFSQLGSIVPSSSSTSSTSENTSIIVAGGGGGPGGTSPDSNSNSSDTSGGETSSTSGTSSSSTTTNTSTSTTVSSTSTTTISSSTSGSPFLFDPQAISNSLFQGFDQQTGLCAQNASGSGTTPIIWQYLANGINVPRDSTHFLLTHVFEPNENLKNAFLFVEYPPANSPPFVGSTLLQSIRNLPTQPYMVDGYHLPWNDESMVGIAIPSQKVMNDNIDLCGPPDPLLRVDGLPFGVFQATPVDTFGIPCKFSDPILNFSGNTVNTIAISETMYQVMNRFLRGAVTHDDNPNANAQDLLDSVASIAWKDPLGCVGFGGGINSNVRGIYLGDFLHCSRTMNYVSPMLQNAQGGPITLADIDFTLAQFQKQKLIGGIPRNYNSFSNFASSDNETNNMAGIAYCFNLQATMRQTSASGVYDMKSLPPTTL